jgi:hypothetical protein
LWALQQCLGRQFIAALLIALDSQSPAMSIDFNFGMSMVSLSKSALMLMDLRSLSNDRPIVPYTHVSDPYAVFCLKLAYHRLSPAFLVWFVFLRTPRCLGLIGFVSVGSFIEKVAP